MKSSLFFFFLVIFPSKASLKHEVTNSQTVILFCNEESAVSDYSSRAFSQKKSVACKDGEY